MSDKEVTGPERRARGGRRLLRLGVIGLAAIAGIYVLACGGLYVFQSRLLYHPWPEYKSTPADRQMACEDVKLTTADGVSLTAWFLPHPAPKATILYFHGNTGNIGNLMTWSGTLHRLGCSVMLPDYRGFGRSEGEPSEEGLYQDADAAWEYLVNRRGVRAEQIVVMGRSLGGAVAIYTAERHRPAGLVAECTFTSIVDIGSLKYPYVPVGWLCRHRFESIARVPHITCPKLFYHGTDDRTVPIENARRLFAAAAEPKEFVETLGGHGRAGFQYDEPSTRRLDEWLDKTVGAAGR